MSRGNLFLHLDVGELDQVARRHGFRSKGRRNWVRRTADFVQLVNLQRSQWSAEDHYVNFALWPLALGEPPTIAESKFPFRTRGERLGVRDLDGFFAAVDRLRSLADLREAQQSGRLAGLTTRVLQELLA